MLPSSEQWNTYKHLHLVGKRWAARQIWAFIFIEWSYGIEVLGRNSAEDRGLPQVSVGGAQGLSLKFYGGAETKNRAKV